ncbi:hypothetical protein C0J08_03155 [Marinomonas sp. CT5]|nr:hypothetical protein C0J08_03155 [Marinomonas sp. CT5]
MFRSLNLPQNFPVEWIEPASTLSLKINIKQRHPPEEPFLWFISGVSLFRDESIKEVTRRLNTCSEKLVSERLLTKISYRAGHKSINSS